MTRLWLIDSLLDSGRVGVYRLVSPLLLMATLFMCALPVLIVRVLVTSDWLLVGQGLNSGGRVLCLNAHVVVDGKLVALHYFRPGIAIIQHHMLAGFLHG